MGEICVFGSIYGFPQGVVPAQVKVFEMPLPKKK